MNKKHWVTIGLAAFVLVSGIITIIIINAANAFKPLADAPATCGVISGNGSNAVSITDASGTWLYYVGNYYADVNEIKYKQNEYNKLPNNNFGAIYRVKLNEQARLDYKLLEDESGDINPYAAKNCQVVVPKIAGFDKTALWVFNGYLIYTTPNNTLNKVGDRQVNKIDFFRVELTGKDNRKIYTTTEDHVPRTNFTVVAPAANKMYLLVNDGGRLVRVTAHNKDFGDVDVISKKAAASFAFPFVDSFDMDSLSGGDLQSSYNDGVMKYVYFTIGRDEDARIKKGNVLKRYDINSGTTVTLADSISREFSVLKMSSGKLMYAVKELPGEAYDIYLTKKEGTKVTRADNSTYWNFVDEDDKLTNVSNDELSEIYYLPTESTGNAPVVFLGLSGGNLHIYRNENQYDFQGTEYSASLAAGTKVDLVKGVSYIISITKNRLFYLTANNEVRAISLEDGKPAGGTNELPALENCVASNTVSYFRIPGQGERVFFIKEFTEGENTTNIAVMVEFWNETKPQEFVLGVVGEKYLHDADDDHTH